jgi:hypothetical protein
MSNLLKGYNIKLSGGSDKKPPAYGQESSSSSQPRRTLRPRGNVEHGENPVPHYQRNVPPPIYRPPSATLPQEPRRRPVEESTNVERGRIATIRPHARLRQQYLAIFNTPPEQMIKSETPSGKRYMPIENFIISLKNFLKNSNFDKASQYTQLYYTFYNRNIYHGDLNDTQKRFLKRIIDVMNADAHGKNINLDLPNINIRGGQKGGDVARTREDYEADQRLEEERFDERRRQYINQIRTGMLDRRDRHQETVPQAVRILRDAQVRENNPGLAVSAYRTIVSYFLDSFDPFDDPGPNQQNLDFLSEYTNWLQGSPHIGEDPEVLYAIASRYSYHPNYDFLLRFVHDLVREQDEIRGDEGDEGEEEDMRDEDLLEEPEESRVRQREDDGDENPQPEQRRRIQGGKIKKNNITNKYSMFKFSKPQKGSGPILSKIKVNKIQKKVKKSTGQTLPKKEIKKIMKEVKKKRKIERDPSYVKPKQPIQIAKEDAEKKIREGKAIRMRELGDSISWDSQAYDEARGMAPKGSGLKGGFLGLTIAGIIAAASAAASSTAGTALITGAATALGSRLINKMGDRADARRAKRRAKRGGSMDIIKNKVKKAVEQTKVTAGDLNPTTKKAVEAVYNKLKAKKSPTAGDLKTAANKLKPHFVKELKSKVEKKIGAKIPMSGMGDDSSFEKAFKKNMKGGAIFDEIITNYEPSKKLEKEDEDDDDEEYEYEYEEEEEEPEEEEEEEPEDKGLDKDDLTVHRLDDLVSMYNKNKDSWTLKKHIVERLLSILPRVDMQVLNNMIDDKNYDQFEGLIEDEISIREKYFKVKPAPEAEQPKITDEPEAEAPAAMVGSGKKSSNLCNPWLCHVKKVKKEHPNKAYKEILQMAKLTYKK